MQQRLHDSSFLTRDTACLFACLPVCLPAIVTVYPPRGLKAALIEREDFASGTSSKSTKLVHGGVRYLEKAGVTTVSEAVQPGKRSANLCTGGALVRC